MIKIGDKVNTPYGFGVVVKEEVFRLCERWGVELEKNPFNFKIVFFYKEEVFKI